MALTSCADKSPAARFGRQVEEVRQQTASRETDVPALETVPDSASYLMGYIYGKGIDNMIARGRMPELDGMNREDFETGVAMALAADSTQMSLLYGIMTGLELRGNMHSVSRDIDLKWNRRLTFKGFYQGLGGDTPGTMSAAEAEESLNGLLRPFFLQGVSDGSEDDR